MLNLPDKTVVITGPPGSGKTTVATHLKNFGFPAVVAASDIIRRICIRKGIAPSRSNLQEYGERLLQKRGTTHFAKLLIKEAGNSDKAVIEGVRSPDVVRHLKNMLPQTLVVFINAPKDIRAERLNRKEELTEAEYSQMMKKPIENMVFEIRPMADVVLVNDEDIPSMLEKIDQAIPSNW